MNLEESCGQDSGEDFCSLRAGALSQQPLLRLRGEHPIHQEFVFRALLGSVGLLRWSPGSAQPPTAPAARPSPSPNREPGARSPEPRCWLGENAGLRTRGCTMTAGGCKEAPKASRCSGFGSSLLTVFIFVKEPSAKNNVRCSASRLLGRRHRPGRGKFASTCNPPSSQMASFWTWIFKPQT